MNEERKLSILLRPHVSEKASQSSSGFSQYVFEVLKDASKPELKEAVEKLFDVSVRSVRTMNVKKSKARFGKSQGWRSGWKKAYVTLEKDQQIDLTAK